MKKDKQRTRHALSTRWVIVAPAIWSAGVCTLTLAGCGGASGRSTYAISGPVQKGPFIRSSTISIQELNSDFEPTGITYETETIEGAGEERNAAALLYSRGGHR